MGRQKTTAGQPVSIRISDRLMSDLDAAKEELELSLHDTMRQSMKVGLEMLKRCDYDLASTVVDAGSKIIQYSTNTEDQTGSKVAEDTPAYGAKK